TEIDVEVLLEQFDARVADLLSHEHLRPHWIGGVRTRLRRAGHICSRTQSMQAVRASTSAGSVAGNMAIRSWLRPSLRYGSVSTMPLARRTAATAEASTSSSKSIVPTTSERLAGSATNGVAWA